MPITPNHLPPCATGSPAASRYAVSLIDRHSGRPHMIAGIPLVLMTGQPCAAARDLMRHRDRARARWNACIEPIARKGAVL